MLLLFEELPSRERGTSSGPLTWYILAAIILFWTVVFIISAVNQSRKKKRKIQEEKDYGVLYVRTVTFTDMMMFGTITAEFNTLTGILKAENIRLPKFGSQAPNAILVENYKDAYHETVLRHLNTAYTNAQDILLRMAERMLPLLNPDPETGSPTLSELADRILVTDFQFADAGDSLTMLIVAGAEYANETFSLSALYLPDPVHWEYEAEKIECSEEQWKTDGETTIS